MISYLKPREDVERSSALLFVHIWISVILHKSRLQLDTLKIIIILMVNPYFLLLNCINYYLTKVRGNGLLGKSAYLIKSKKSK